MHSQPTQIPARLGLVFAAFVVAQAADAQAQDPVAWESEFADALRSSNSPTDIMLTPDEGVVMVVDSFEPQTTDRTHVIKFNENGDLVWDWSVGFRAPVAGATDAAGNIYVVYMSTAGGNGARIMSLDMAGVMRWSAVLDGPPTTFGYRAFDLDVSPAGEVRVAGAYFVGNVWPRAMVHAFDSTGSPLWRWNAGGVSPASFPMGYPNRVLLATTGETYLIGETDFCCDRAWSVHVLSPNGLELAWDRGPGGNSTYYSHLAALGPSGEVAVAYNGSHTPFGAPTVVENRVRVYSGGSTYTVDLLPFSSSSVEATDVEFDTSGNLLVALDDLNSVLRFDPSGTPLPAWPLPPAGIDSIGSLASTIDGGVIALCSGTQAGETVLVRLDASGNALSLQTRPGRLSSRASHGLPQIVFDSRGNWITTNTSLGLERASVTKWIDGPGVGAAYCGPANLNSLGLAGQTRVYGAEQRAQNNLTAISSNLPVGTTVLFLVSSGPGFVANPGGSAGNLCLGGQVGRYVGPGQVRRSQADGTASLQLHLSAIPQPMAFQSAMAGDTWRFQSMYRDVVNSARSSNFTDAVAVTLQ